MTKKKDAVPPGNSEESCGCAVGSGCRMEALLSVDERGQMVLPKDLREKAGIRPGDKLALFTLENEGGFCCMALVKAENVSTLMTTILGPLGRKVQEK
jgi:antitoxin PrlF